MAETVEGGVYKVGDQWLDANGNEVPEPKAKRVEVEEEPEGEPKRGPGRPRGS